jgi:uncharacterized protein YjbI with pentapeptide repeats
MTSDEDSKDKGFFNRPRVGGQTIWDWMQLLLIPVILVIVGSYFSYQQTQTNLQVSQQQHQQNQASALDQQQATILQTYIDNIQYLLLNTNLLKSKPIDDVAILARARTLTALHGLDPDRRGRLLIFLHEAHLIGFFDDKNKKTDDAIIDLSGADLRGAMLGGITNLYGLSFPTNLSGAKLGGTNLYGAELYVTNLSNADLIGADLREANLEKADLGNAKITQQQLDQVLKCKGATLSGVLKCRVNQ